MKWTIPLLFVSFMSACAHQHLEQIKPKMVGMHVTEVVDLLGTPSSSVEIAGVTYVKWDNVSQMTLVTPQTQTTSTYGNVGNTPVNAYSTTTKNQSNTYHYSCEFTVRLDENSRVARADHSGNQHACRRYAIRLSSLRK